MKQYYINAVTELLLQGEIPDVVLTNLKKALIKKGHTRILSAILKGVLVQLSKAKATQVPQIVLSDKKDIDVFIKEINESLTQLNADTKTAQVSIDPTIVGGYMTLYNNSLIDNSYKKKLVTLYRSLTK